MDQLINQVVLIGASPNWSHITLLSTWTIMLAKLFAQTIKLKAQFPDYQVKSICFDDSLKFTSMTFNDYYVSMGLILSVLFPTFMIKNGLVKSLIKRLLVIAQTLLLQTQLSNFA